jgi:flagellar basal body-associated protein FliL
MSSSKLFIVLLILILSLFQATSASNFTLNHKQNQNHNLNQEQQQNSTRKPILIPEGPLAVFVRLAGLVGILIMGMR